MPLTIQRLIRVGKAKQADIAAWAEGVSLTADSGEGLDTLKRRVTVARFNLASEMNRFSRLAMAAPRPMYRHIVSRSYYCMYHAMRAATYIFHGGDDHEAHSVLPSKVPNDFPAAANWSNQLKSAREYRNRADYDPYPNGMVYWRKLAEGVYVDATNLIPVVRTYLRGKGCAL